MEKRRNTLCISRFSERISGGKDLGAPSKAQRSGFGGVRRSSGATELLPQKGKTKDAKLATTQSADAFVRCCPSTIHLNIFPTEANEISSIFMEFTDNMHRQMWLIGKDIPTFESLEAKGAEITSLTFNASGMGVAGEGFGSKNIAKLRDDIYFVVKGWKSIPTSEYLIFHGEKG